MSLSGGKAKETKWFAEGQIRQRRTRNCPADGRGTEAGGASSGEEWWRPGCRGLVNCGLRGLSQMEWVAPTGGEYRGTSECAGTATGPLLWRLEARDSGVPGSQSLGCLDGEQLRLLPSLPRQLLGAAVWASNTQSLCRCGWILLALPRPIPKMAHC
ncbi:hypothetical protein NDU88_001028 [Pleurodeles waltl]|uniref:Uncharacterized protein n=1 Tax=Pleurodeles waltl TaxID=8319 RepID=A0AAV7V8C4_PLEWA|nr:hypothetical protein NDU88_001028 [Pleurodeles waltl]